jgi:hypothetical protein
MRLPQSLLLILAQIVVSGSSTVHSSNESARKECTVTPLGGKQDDVPHILKAFKECNGGGTIVFPEKSEYWIASKFNPVVNDVQIEWRGRWTVCTPLFISSLPYHVSLVANNNMPKPTVLGKSNLLARPHINLRNPLPKPPRLIHPLRQRHSHLRPWHRWHKRQRRNVVQR